MGGRISRECVVQYPNNGRWKVDWQRPDGTSNGFSTLFRDKIEEKDAGNYTCIAINNKGAKLVHNSTIQIRELPLLI